jgi:hypothetical protein
MVEVVDESDGALSPRYEEALRQEAQRLVNDPDDRAALEALREELDELMPESND